MYVESEVSVFDPYTYLSGWTSKLSILTILKIGFQRIWEDHNNLPACLHILESGTGQDFIARLQTYSSQQHVEIGYLVLTYGRRMLTVGGQASADKCAADEQKIECGTPAGYKQELAQAF